jgi:hypothetical protein
MTADNSPSFNVEDLRLHEIDEIWNGVDAATVGRFLRAHLVVEHVVNEHLRKLNPSLGEFGRLTFSAKVGLLNPGSAFVQWIRPGIRKMNSLRNNFAHQLHYELTDDDVRFIFGSERDLPKYLNAFKRIADPSKVTEPIDVIEAFADFVCQMLRLETTLSDKLHESIKVAQQEQREQLARLVRLAGEDVVADDKEISRARFHEQDGAEVRQVLQRVLGLLFDLAVRAHHNDRVFHFCASRIVDSSSASSGPTSRWCPSTLRNSP